MSITFDRKLSRKRTTTFLKARENVYNNYLSRNQNKKILNFNRGAHSKCAPDKKNIFCRAHIQSAPQPRPSVKIFSVHGGPSKFDWSHGYL